MTRYLISFDAHAMDHIPDEDMPAVAKASHEVVEEALNVSAADWKTRKRASWKPTGRSLTARTRRLSAVLCRRRALTRGRAGVGCQERRRLSLRARSPGVHARPGRGELIGHVDLVFWATVRNVPRPNAGRRLRRCLQSAR